MSYSARGPSGYITERRRLAYFPALVARVPELRRELLIGRTFLTWRSLRFDLALAGVALAARRRSALPLVAALPYAAWLCGRAASHRQNAPLVAATEVAAALSILTACAKSKVMSVSILGNVVR